MTAETDTMMDEKQLAKTSDAEMIGHGLWKTKLTTFEEINEIERENANLIKTVISEK